MSIAQPLLGYGATGPAPVNAFFNQFIFDPTLKYVAAGIADTGGGNKSAVRSATAITSLPTPPNTLVGIGAPLNACYVGGGMIVVADSVGGVATSQDSVAWNTGVNPLSPSFVAPGMGGCYDDVNNKIIVAMSGSLDVLTATPSAGPITFAAHAITTGANPFISVSHRQGSNVTLGLTSANGANPGDVHRSTDGGATWTRVATNIFAASNAYVILWTGGTQWIALGGNGTQGLLCISTNDGASWSAPTAWGGADGASFVGSDGSGNLVLLLNASPPDNYWVSSNHGTTWTSPNLFSSQDGPGAFGVFYTGTVWVASFTSADDSAQFFATSSDGGNSWVPGSNVTD